MIPPLGYMDFLHLMSNATLVTTDSGGVQEETTCLGVPCVTVRENTERPITIWSGTNILAGVKSEGIRRAIRQQLKSKPSGVTPEKWDGKSAERILSAICCEFQNRVAALAMC
jgi:UDP-N-acetylglucosamine 2-epimerase (non-hydrolysing)